MFSVTEVNNPFTHRMWRKNLFSRTEPFHVRKVMTAVVIMVLMALMALSFSYDCPVVLIQEWVLTWVVFDGRHKKKDSKLFILISSSPESAWSAR